nr:MAG TPA: hypothetical protein [Caudoviricetes sp.]
MLPFKVKEPSITKNPASRFIYLRGYMFPLETLMGIVHPKRYPFQ